jgi:hypothetical protein
MGCFFRLKLVACNGSPLRQGHDRVHHVYQVLQGSCLPSKPAGRQDPLPRMHPSSAVLHKNAGCCSQKCLTRTKRRVA